MNYFGRLIFLLSFISLVAMADCQNINLYTKTNSPFQNMPILNQDSTGTCYAHAAAQLIDYERFKSDPDSKKLGTTDPIWLASLYANKEWFKSDLSSGTVVTALDYLRSNGICKKSVVDSAIKTYKSGNNLTHAELLSVVEELYENWYKIDNYSKNPFAYGVRNEEQYESFFNNVVTNSCSATVKGKVKHPLDNVTKSATTLRGNISKIVPEVIFNEIFKKCVGGNLYKPKIGKAKETCTICKDSDVSLQIKKVLKEEKPVEMSFCASVLYDKDYRGISSTRNKTFSPIPRGMSVISENDKKKSNGKSFDGCGRHAALITGSRTNSKTKKCEYLVRNSWGSAHPRSYDSAFQNCLCEKTVKGKKTYFECNKSTSAIYARVGCWLTEEALVPNIYSLTHY